VTRNSQSRNLLAGWATGESSWTEADRIPAARLDEFFEWRFNGSHGNNPIGPRKINFDSTTEGNEANKDFIGFVTKFCGDSLVKSVMTCMNGGYGNFLQIFLASHRSED